MISDRHFCLKCGNRAARHGDTLCDRCAWREARALLRDAARILCRNPARASIYFGCSLAVMMGFLLIGASDAMTASLEKEP